MARHISITDDANAVRVTITVESANGTSRVTALNLQADGEHGITRDDLELLAQLGLPVPATLLPAAPAPADAPPAPAPQAGADIIRRSDGRLYRRAPADEVLIDAYAKLGGDSAALADLYGVPLNTAKAWLRRLRRQGKLPASKRATTTAKRGRRRA